MDRLKLANFGKHMDDLISERRSGGSPRIDSDFATIDRSDLKPGRPLLNYVDVTTM